MTNSNSVMVPIGLVNENINFKRYKLIADPQAPYMTFFTANWIQRPQVVFTKQACMFVVPLSTEEFELEYEFVIPHALEEHYLDTLQVGSTNDILHFVRNTVQRHANRFLRRGTTFMVPKTMFEKTKIDYSKAKLDGDETLLVDFQVSNNICIVGYDTFKNGKITVLTFECSRAKLNLCRHFVEYKMLNLPCGICPQKLQDRLTSAIVSKNSRK